ncbi:uncharacterized protein TRIVIDRAFT_58336 [Trichoderma virens Gv29-8]|uniref:BTB domain-containing protein n=1 Tax=Hypocrea virens (strain Gv29-8 / FGSC 10586) TaxID=413071 RepID=G9N1R7_HYPVG|nr:uncharacterized protein TRIVIDRAFT_58336 [Trichoderma virens Gv29-8]EHK19696.1 hypothetical protein TRIVIDRAFT_58336 [Trichoderma virens Gv29-8]UKZ58051.1 hypothetical protein TrVGV298_011913 [Trichoderma virens]
MKPTFHEIDPDGDTLLILHNANAPFAELPSISTPQEEPIEPASTPKDDAADKSQEQDESESTVRMRLSSKHLILASTYFKKMAGNNWKETTPEAGYSYVINAQDWDENALLIVMRIIHGRTAKVPRQLKLETLAKIAVLVDYYQCHEIVGFFAQTWLTESSLRQVQDEGKRNLMLRLVVSMVFPENEELPFWILSEKIIQKSTGPIDALGLPIRQDVIDALNERREKAILGVLHGFRILKTRLRDDETSCSFECSSIYLGALHKATKKMKLTNPRPSPPYRGISLFMLEEAIRGLREPTELPKPASTPSILPACNLAAKTKPIIDELLAGIHGLQLGDFVKLELNNT